VSTHGLGAATPTVQKGKRGMLWLAAGLGAFVIAALVIGLTVVPAMMRDAGPAATAAGNLPGEKTAGQPGKQEAADEDFVPKPVTLKFLGLPGGAVVTVDDVLLKNNPAIIDPAPSRRRIVVEAEGYMPWKVEQIVDANTTIDVAMKKLEPDKAASSTAKKGSGTKAAADKTKPKDSTAGKDSAAKSGTGTYKGKVKLSEHDYPE
jgi:hypothetical protein